MTDEKAVELVQSARQPKIAAALRVAIDKHNQSLTQKDDSQGLTKEEIMKLADEISHAIVHNRIVMRTRARVDNLRKKRKSKGDGEKIEEQQPEKKKGKGEETEEAHAENEKTEEAQLEKKGTGEKTEEAQLDNKKQSLQQQRRSSRKKTPEKKKGTPTEKQKTGA